MKDEISPIFIVGAPRSGTTWLLTILENHPQCSGVTPEMLSIKLSLPTKETGIFARGLPSREIRERFLNAQKNTNLVEKTPAHLLETGRIKRTFPEARIILIKRNPDDAILSMLQPNDFWPSKPKTLENAVHLYNQYAEAEFCYVNFDLTIYYEDLWNNPSQEVARILTHLNLDPSYAMNLVNKTHAGRALPAALKNVFREGTPNQSKKKLTKEERAYIKDKLRRPENTSTTPLILIATNHLLGWTGTETLLLTLIKYLTNHGCRLVVYTRHWNPDWLDKNFDSRIRITNNLHSVSSLEFTCAHVHHNSCLIDVRTFFPYLPIAFYSLGVIPFLEQPPPLPLNICIYFAISKEVKENLISQNIPPQHITLIPNLVDEDQFSPTSPANEKIKHILVLSNKIDEQRANLLISAAKEINASITFAGGKNNAISQNNLPQLINQHDLVVSIGRGALEAMLCERQVLIYDLHGGDGLVNPGNFHDLAESNFSGRRYGREYTINDIIIELSKYNNKFVSDLRQLATIHSGVKHNISRLINIYKEMATHKRSQPLPNETQQALNFISKMAHEDITLANYWQNAALHSLDEINRIKRTFSWRVTAPLRYLKRLKNRRH